MEKIIINSFEEFKNYEGKELGVSGYHQITQEQINKFAEATLDYQWIHTDPERAAKESPFGTTIAHGYLTLSLVPYLWNQIIEVRNVKLLVNYGMEKLRFGQAVKVDQKVMLRAKLRAINDLRGIIKTEVDITLEIENEKKPAFKGTAMFLYHFK